MIVGYIHVCQKGDWVRSLRMLTDVIRSSGLYENTHIIRIGIVNDEGKIVDNDILNDDTKAFVDEVFNTKGVLDTAGEIKDTFLGYGKRSRSTNVRNAYNMLVRGHGGNLKKNKTRKKKR